MVGNTRPAHRAEVDSGEVFQSVQSVGVHHLAGFEVVLAAPREVLVLKGETAGGLLGETIEHTNALGHDLFADPIARDDRDSETARIGHGSGVQANPARPGGARLCHDMPMHGKVAFITGGRARAGHGGGICRTGRGRGGGLALRRALKPPKDSSAGPRSRLRRGA